MGMFDYVKYEAPCSKCGEPLKEWQSKSRKDADDCMMQTLQPEDVENFYTSCPKCETWNEYKVTQRSGYSITLEDPECERCRGLGFVYGTDGKAKDCEMCKPK